jgi:peptidylprolyl isomerase
MLPYRTKENLMFTTKAVFTSLLLVLLTCSFAVANPATDAAKKGEDFLASNAKQDDITTLPSGLQYRILKKGEGIIPEAKDQVTVHYRGTLIDGTEFDSSFKRNRPATFGVNRVIAGWTEALQLMQEGAKWQLFIPSNLAYGTRGSGRSIGPNEALIFEVELLKVMSLTHNKKKGQAFLKENSGQDGVKILPSGLQYKVISTGSGKTPGSSDSVTVHYRGTLIDGTEFDSSIKRGQPATFPVNGVIKGWTEALQLMQEGSKWQLFIPADLAYGPRSAGALIEPYSTLIFEVELIKVN